MTLFSKRCKINFAILLNPRFLVAFQDRVRINFQTEEPGMEETTTPVSSQNWVKERLAEIREIKEPSEQVEALIELASKLLPSSSEVLKKALKAARNINDEESRSQALAAIAPHLPETERQKVLDEALNAALKIEDRYADSAKNDRVRSQALAAIAPHLPETEPQLLEEALNAARNINDEESRSKALAAIAPNLSETERQKEVLEKALNAARNINNEESRSHALAAIAPHLPETERQKVLQEALNAAKNIKNSYYGLPGMNENLRSKALAAIAPHLSETEPQLLEEALNAARNINNEESRSHALAAIVPNLPETKRKEVLQEAKDAARNINNEKSRSHALAAIAPHLPEKKRQKLLDEALEAALNINNEKSRSQALAAIAPNLPETKRKEVLQEAKDAARNINNEKSRSHALAAIAPHLPETEPQLLDEALNAARNINDEESRSKALAAIAPHLPNAEERLKLLKEAWNDAVKPKDSEENIESNSQRLRGLAAIAPNLPDAERLKLLKEALKAAQNIEIDHYRSEALAPIVPNLPETEPQLLQEQEALKIILELETDKCVKPLGRLVHKFSEEIVAAIPRHHFSKALATVAELKAQPEDQIKFFSALAPQLPTALFSTALERVKDHTYLSEALSNLAPYIPTDQISEALSLIKKAGYSADRTSALLNLVPYVETFEQILQTLEIIKQDIPVQYHKARCLTALATSLCGEKFNSSSYSITEDKKSTPETSDSSSLDVNKVLQNIRTTIDETEKKDSEKFTAIVQGILAMVKQLEFDEKHQSQILVALAPALPSQFLENVLEMIQHFKDIGYQVNVLCSLAPFMADDEQKRLEIANQLIDNIPPVFYQSLYQIKVWSCFRDKQDGAIKKAKEIDQNLKYLRTEALVEIAAQLQALAPRNITPTQLQKISTAQRNALSAIRDLNNSYLQSQHIQRLAPHLRLLQLLEAKNVAQEIKKQNYKVEALVALACHFPSIRQEVQKDIETNIEKNTLTNIQGIKHLSTLALEVPNILPDILKRIDKIEKQSSKEKSRRYGILVALIPHLPARINREVNRVHLSESDIPDELWKRSCKLLAITYREILQGGSLRNESAQDEDFLNLKDEINSLSDLLLMRDLEPPMAVGILGGWGGGKSYIMHLMQSHMTEVRSKPVTEEEAWNTNPNYEKLSPYVGHIYQIKFDAWTFAKSDLWASLMQTIFFELDRQISLEAQITKILKDLDNNKRTDIESKIWQVLYKTNDTDRKWFLERVLTDKTLLEKLSGIQGETTGKLWETLNKTQQKAIEQFKKTQNQLEIARLELDFEKAKIRKEIEDQFASPLDLKHNKSFQRVDAFLGTSLILLRKLIGPRLVKDIYDQINQELYGEKIGLWENLNETLKKLEDARKKLAELEKEEPKSSEQSSAQKNEQSDSNKKEDIEKKTQEINKFLLEVEGIKFDINTVATNIIEEKTWQINFATAWQWVAKNWLLLLLFLIFFISPVLLLTFLGINLIEIGTATFGQILTSLAALVSPILPAFVTLKSLFRSGSKWFEETQLALHEYEKSVENRNKNLENTFESKLKTRWQKDSELQKLERNVRQLEIQVKQQQQALPANEYASLNDFVSDRLSSKTYANRLGLMQQVKEDLFDLSNKLLPPNDQSLESKIGSLKKAFPRGPARVVVYIDDLDRCPPDRVVEVLEAVQLLVKTPLFIAVLAIDERYITRALEKYYEGVLSRRGRPSGTDYLEKIIQLPYRVRPIMASSLENYLRSQIVLQDSATSGAKFSEFSRQEFNILLDCCKQVDLAPRTLKRLTNVYKLFKIVCRTRANKPSYQVQKAILALLALSGRYTDLMRGIFDDIETCFEEKRTSEKARKTLQTLHLQSPLRDFFKHYQLPDSDKYLHQEFQKLRHDALHTTILPDQLTLTDMTHEIFNLIRSFSFVGEIGEDPEDGALDKNSSNS